MVTEKDKLALQLLEALNTCARIAYGKPEAPERPPAEKPSGPRKSAGGISAEEFRKMHEQNLAQQKAIMEENAKLKAMLEKK